MKRIFVSIIAVLSAVVFSSCSLVTNNYYQQNESAASSETAVNTVPAANSETAKETQPVKEDNAASAVSAADAPQSANLNDEEWYVVTAGKYSTENEAKNQLSEVKKKYPDAYVKYSGEYKKSSSNASYSSFYGIWVYASKSYDEASSFAGEVSSNGFQGFVFTTTDWSNLNSEKWYVVTAGQYGTEKEAINKLDAVQNYYPDAYVKFSGDHISN